MARASAGAHISDVKSVKSKGLFALKEKHRYDGNIYTVETTNHDIADVFIWV